MMSLLRGVNIHTTNVVSHDDTFWWDFLTQTQKATQKMAF